MLPLSHEAAAQLVPLVEGPAAAANAGAAALFLQQSVRPAPVTLTAACLPALPCPLQIINPGATLIQVLEWTLLNSTIGERLRNGPLVRWLLAGCTALQWSRCGSRRVQRYWRRRHRTAPPRDGSAPGSAPALSARTLHMPLLCGCAQPPRLTLLPPGTSSLCSAGGLLLCGLHHRPPLDGPHAHAGHGLCLDG